MEEILFERVVEMEVQWQGNGMALLLLVNVSINFGNDYTQGISYIRENSVLAITVMQVRWKNHLITTEDL